MTVRVGCSVSDWMRVFVVFVCIPKYLGKSCRGEVLLRLSGVENVIMQSNNALLYMGIAIPLAAYQCFSLLFIIFTVHYIHTCSALLQGSVIIPLFFMLISCMTFLLVPMSRPQRFKGLEQTALKFLLKSAQ